MKICITGVAGFVGSTLADRLLAEGHEIWGMDDLKTGRIENVHPDVEFMHRAIWPGMVNEAPTDLIIHCAASYADPLAIDDDIETNVLGGAIIAITAQVWKSRIIYFQTVLPPISSYAISKIAGEHYLRLSGQPLTVFRLASIYGPRLLSGAIPTFFKRIKAGEPCTVVEDATRDFVFIDDLVARVLANIEEPINGRIDVRTGKEISIKSIPLAIGEMLGIEPIVNLVPRREDDVAHYEMGGTPRVGTPFFEGLRRTVEWYEENGVEQTFTHLNFSDRQKASTERNSEILERLSDG